VRRRVVRVLVRRAVRLARLDEVAAVLVGGSLEGGTGRVRERSRRRERRSMIFERDGERAWRNVSR
jgi:hypothetical protein